MSEICTYCGIGCWREFVTLELDEKTLVFCDRECISGYEQNNYKPLERGFVRKIVQIAFTNDENDIYALCDDGTIWLKDRNDGKVYSFDFDIPQGDE